MIIKRVGVKGYVSCFCLSTNLLSFVSWKMAKINSTKLSQTTYSKSSE